MYVTHVMLQPKEKSSCYFGMLQNVSVQKYVEVTKLFGLVQTLTIKP